MGNIFGVAKIQILFGVLEIPDIFFFFGGGGGGEWREGAGPEPPYEVKWEYPPWRGFHSLVCDPWFWRLLAQGHNTQQAHNYSL